MSALVTQKKAVGSGTFLMAAGAASPGHCLPGPTAPMGANSVISLAQADGEPELDGASRMRSASASKTRQ
jgi:hypothetical protein